jgi:hypothetical protein
MKIKCALVCDDSRIEDNGKHIIIGVYSNNVAVEHFPATIGLTLWFQMLVGKAGEIDFEVRARDAFDRKKLFSAFEGKMNINQKEEPITMKTPQFLIQTEEPVKIVFEMRESGKRWSKIIEIPIQPRV